jgi:hypothetical protein
MLYPAELLALILLTIIVIVTYKKYFDHFWQKNRNSPQNRKGNQE